MAIITLEPYTQSFNSLPITRDGPWVNNFTIPGWYLPGGISLITADDGSSSTNAIYSYGSTSAADRALGTKTANTFKVIFKNNTGGVIRHVKVSYRLEVWRKTSGQTKPMTFSYVQAPQINPAAAYTETTVTELQANAYSSANAGALDGNLEFVAKEFLIQNINLPAGHEIRFSWATQQATWGLAIDDVVIEPKNALKFYNNSLTDLSLLSSWGTNQDGSGTQPLSFTDADQEFHIANYPPNTSLNLPSSWTVSGTNSKIVLGNGTNAATMRLLNGHSMATTMIGVADNVTFAINAKTLPLLGTLSPASTVVFEKEAPAEITGCNLFGTLVLNSGKQSKLAKKVKVKGNLVLQDAKLELGNYDLELDYGASIQSSSAANYVVINGQGRLRQAMRAGQELTLPVGNATYNPVKIKLAAGSQDDIFSVSVLDGVYNAYTNDVPDLNAALTDKTVNKTWIVSEDVKGGSDITLTLSWSLTDALAGFNPLDCHIKHYEYGAWDEATPGAAIATVTGSVLTGFTTTYSITRSGITSFSPFTVSSKEPVVLPVDLLHFVAKATQDHTVELSWSTAMEQHNDYFAIEASEDGRHFREIGRVKGTGNSCHIRHYRFTHPLNSSAVTYYRLRQADLDKTITYSKAVAVGCRAMPAARLSAYPNPGKGRYYISAGGDAARILASVCDASGKVVLPAQPLGFSDGQYLVDLSNQGAGIYLLHLVTKNSRQVLRLVKN